MWCFYHACGSGGDTWHIGRVPTKRKKAVAWESKNEYEVYDPQDSQPSSQAPTLHGLNAK